MRKKITFYFLLSFFYSQSQIQEINFFEKVNTATLIVEGRIVSSTSFYDDTQNNIYTAHELEVYKIMKGTLNSTSTIYILTPGGMLGSEALEVFPSLNLFLDEEGAFFLKPNTVSVNSSGVNSGLIYQPASNAQSKYVYNCSDGKVKGLFQEFISINEFYTEMISGTGQDFQELSSTAPCSNTGKLKTQSVIQVSGFFPAVIPAGAKQKLTITGSGFGSTFVAQKIWFRNNSNPNQWQTVSSALVEASTWSDTQIEVLVPDFAGTGQIAVSSSGRSSLVYSNQGITVPYAELNSGNFQTQHKDDNSLGGYTWEMSSGFNTTPNAKIAFLRALETWTCRTNMNWSLSNTITSLDVTARDNVNIVRFDPNLSSGVLGVCYSRWSFCGGDRFVNEMDIVFNPNKNWNYSTNAPTGTQHDFETVALHELGHGRQLKHMIDNSKVMHYALGTGVQKRGLTQDEIDGGQDVHQRSTTIILCSQPTMTNGICPTQGVDDTQVLKFDVYPNPAHHFINLKGSISIGLHYQIINMLGKKMDTGIINSNNIPIAQLKPGVYFLKLYGSQNIKTFKFIKN